MLDWYEYAYKTGILITPKELASILNMVDEGKITNHTGKYLIRKMWEGRVEIINWMYDNKDYFESCLTM